MGIQHWLRLALTEGIGPILMRRIIDATGSAEAACRVNVAELRNIDGIGSSKAAAIHRSMNSARVDDELARCEKLGVILVCPDDEPYPALLREIPDPPAVLYVKGALEPRDLNGLAIVGSRRCSYYGREQAERFGALLAGAGFTVLSGGARGIDSAAHRGAMSHPSGRTIAVLGSGLDVPYPPENAPLFEQIASDGRGAMISEFALGTPPMKDNFPRRNRIVSGMSRGVLVIEADEKSGALITARQACDDHGRPVFALPGRVDNKLSVGPHQLIRDGAVLCAGIEDIVQGLGPLPESVNAPMLFPITEEREIKPTDAKPQAAEPVGLSEQQRAIVLQLGTDAVDVDTLIERTSIPAHQILQELTFLSLKGVVRRIDGQTYARRS
jgi:DNA processing protein